MPRSPLAKRLWDILSFRAQQLDMIRQQRQLPLRQIDGEEEASTRNEVAAVRGHDGRYHKQARWVSQELNPSYELSL
jgi:hypothetical protein